MDAKLPPPLEVVIYGFVVINRMHLPCLHDAVSKPHADKHVVRVKDLITEIEAHLDQVSVPIIDSRQMLEPRNVSQNLCPYPSVEGFQFWLSCFPNARILGFQFCSGYGGGKRSRSEGVLVLPILIDGAGVLWALIWCSCRLSWRGLRRLRSIVG